MPRRASMPAVAAAANRISTSKATTSSGGIAMSGFPPTISTGHCNVVQIVATRAAIQPNAPADSENGPMPSIEGGDAVSTSSQSYAGAKAVNRSRPSAFARRTAASTRSRSSNTASTPHTRTGASRIVSLENGFLHVRYRHGRDVADDQQEPEHKPCAAAEQNGPLGPARHVGAPRVRVELPRQRRDDDQQPFAPHAEIDQYGCNEQLPRAAAHRRREERERYDRVADEAEPEERRVVADATVRERAAHVSVVSQPGEEELGDVRVGDNQRDRDNELCDVLEMARRHVCPDAQQLSAWNDQREQHRQSREDRAGD